MRPQLSDRASAVGAHQYSDFPVPIDAIDLRQDCATSVVGPLSVLTSGEVTRLEDAATLTAYADVQGLPALRALVAERLQVTAADVLITNGASEAIAIALLIASDAGGVIALPRPGFPAYEELAVALGYHVAPYEINRTGIHDEDLHRLATQADAVVLCEPHNPTGFRRFPAVRLSLASSSAECRWIIADISHATEPFAHGHMNAATEPELLVLSFSKVLRLPGLRLGCLVSRRRDVIEAAVKLKTHLSMAAASMSQLLLARILESPRLQELVTEQELRHAANRRTLLSAVEASTSLDAIGGEAGTHLLVVSANHDNETQIWTRLRNHGVVGLPGSVFRSPYASVRLCYGQDPPVVERASQLISEL